MYDIYPNIFNMVPWDAVMPEGVQNMMNGLSLLLAVLAFWFCMVEVKRRKDWVPIYAFIGGGLGIVYEPLADMLLSAFYPMHGQMVWISLFGRPIPVFLGILWFWYMSVPVLYFLRKLEGGITKAVFWRDYWLLVVVMFGIEAFGVSLHAWIYYGTQAYMMLGVPLWAIFTYSGFTLVTCVGTHMMTTRLDRKHQWLIVLGLPMCVAGGHLAVTLPATAAVFTTSDPLWLYIGASATIALSIGLAWAVSLVYCADSKLNVSPGSRSAKFAVTS